MADLRLLPVGKYVHLRQSTSSLICTDRGGTRKIFFFSTKIIADRQQQCPANFERASHAHTIHRAYRATYALPTSYFSASRTVSLGISETIDYVRVCAAFPRQVDPPLDDVLLLFQHTKSTICRTLSCQVHTSGAFFLAKIVFSVL